MQGTCLLLAVVGVCAAALLLALARAAQRPTSKSVPRLQLTRLPPLGGRRSDVVLYVGNAHDAANRQALNDYGITHVINAAAEVPDYFPNDLSYCRLNLKDQHTEALDQALRKAMTYIDTVPPHASVLVHCHAGRSRSVAVASYLIGRTQGFDYERTASAIRAVYPWAYPNPGYVAQLQRLLP